MLAPAGAPTRLKLSVCAGMSWSLAVAVKLSSVSSCYRLIADRIEHRRNVDFAHRDQ